MRREGERRGLFVQIRSYPGAVPSRARSGKERSLGPPIADESRDFSLRSRLDVSSLPPSLFERRLTLRLLGLTEVDRRRIAM